MANDIRYAVRQLLKSPGFTVVALLTVALGIGANTTIFSLVSGVLLRPLPFREPERLVWIANPALGAEGIPGLTQQANLRDWRKLNHSFEDLAAYLPSFSDRTDLTLTGNGEPIRLKCAFVTGNFLNVLSVQPRLGRGFTVKECQRYGPLAIILTDRFWKRRFHADMDIIGRSIEINKRSWTVVGVLPASFDFSSIFAPGSQEVDFLRPHLDIAGYDNMGNLMAVIGRLKPGLSVPQAQSEFKMLNEQLEMDHPERGRFGARLSPLREHLTGRFRQPFLVLSCAVACVLMIACANLSNLLLARGTARGKEIAIRCALGANRWRLVRQTFTESILLSGCGAVLGLLMAYVATNAMAQSQAFGIPLLPKIRVDGWALVFTMLLAVVTGLVFGSLPALQFSSDDPVGVLKQAGRGAGHGRSRVRLRKALVISEVALACLLLVGAGLLSRSFVRLLEVDPGFRPEGAAAWRIQPNREFATRNGEFRFYDEVCRRVEAIPGVSSASLTDELPMDLNDVLHVRAKGQSYRPDQTPITFARSAQSGYFATMRIPLLAGRDFDSHDARFDWQEPTQKPIIVNERFAHAFWPGKDPLGQIVVLDGPPDPPAECQVVGVVGDVRQSALEQAAIAEVYLPGGGRYLVARAKGKLESIFGPVSRVLREMDATMAVPDPKPLSQIIDRAVSPRRLITLLLGLFSLLALLLTSLGVYGVIAYSVSQRTQEIGVRLALGASVAIVMRLIIREGMGLVWFGCGLGLAGSLALTRVMQSLLFGVSTLDPFAFLLSGVLVSGTALAACWLPAFRASRVDPMVALRSD
ncbi:MAG TPA: ABC transporter permease [Verrucomicrobiae bacterium]|nr:ABC transporter permease [Verrucomicrobiae bacterium]